jgi:hypothetical protein
MFCLFMFGLIVGLSVPVLLGLRPAIYTQSDHRKEISHEISELEQELQSLDETIGRLRPQLYIARGFQIGGDNGDQTPEDMIEDLNIEIRSLSGLLRTVSRPTNLWRRFAVRRTQLELSDARSRIEALAVAAHECTRLIEDMREAQEKTGI